MEAVTCNRSYLLSLSISLADLIEKKGPKDLVTTADSFSHAPCTLFWATGLSQDHSRDVLEGLGTSVSVFAGAAFELIRRRLV